MEIDSLHERALDDRTEEHKLANNERIHQVKHRQSNLSSGLTIQNLTVITQAVLFKDYVCKFLILGFVDQM